MYAIFWLISAALDVLFFFVIANVIISWLIHFGIINTHQQFVQAVSRMLYQVTEPLCRPIRRVMPDLGGIDLSPIILILLIRFTQILLWTSIAPALGVYGR